VGRDKQKAARGLRKDAANFHEHSTETLASAIDYIVPKLASAGNR
jgi:hypothetical protein